MKLVHLVGFIIKKFVTMHGHVNVKNTYVYVIVHACIFLNVVNHPNRFLTCWIPVRWCQQVYQTPSLLLGSPYLSGLTFNTFTMEKISWTDHVRNEEVLLRVNEQRNTLHEIRKQKANWIGHILRRNCLLKQVIEGKIKGEIEVTRRRKKLLDDLKDRRGYYHLKEEALSHYVEEPFWKRR